MSGPERIENMASRVGNSKHIDDQEKDEQENPCQTSQRAKTVIVKFWKLIL